MTDIVENKKGYYFDGADGEIVNLSTIDLPKKKPLNVNLTNTSDEGKTFTSSSHYSEIISVLGGKYNMQLNGINSNKTVKLGDSSGNIVNIANSGKNTVTAGDGGNKFYTNHIYSNNTITSGKGKDSYYLYNGTTKITDKGISDCEKDWYYIYGGKNTVVDKGGENNFDFRPQGIYSDKYITGSGIDTFLVNITGSEGEININSGDGIDTLKIYNDTAGTNNVLVNADLGKGNDIVLVDYKTGSIAKNDSSILNVKTGNGEDTVDIKAGKKNDINTGDGSDTITVHYTAVNTVSTINAGKGEDIVLIEGGENTIYGGNDAITISVGGASLPTQHNTVYASADTINLEGGNNTVYTKQGGNEINIQRKTPLYVPSEEIYLQKGDNTVNYIGNTETSPTEANVHITAGKNIINAEGYSIVNIDTVNSNDKTINIKTKQTITIDGYAKVNSIQLGSGADIITHSSIANETGLSGIKTGAGNDEFYISKGSYKNCWGEAGNDYFEIKGTEYLIADGGKGNDKFDILSGNNNQIIGGEGKDTFTVVSGQYNSVSGDKGKDIFNIERASNCSFDGGDDNDTFNINDKDEYVDIELCEMMGGKGNDTFNIYGGSSNEIYGEVGNDIYNLNMQTGSVEIYENDGENTINVAKGYKGAVSAYKLIDTEATYSVKFDKSYKLTSNANVVDDVITTSDSNITLYLNFLKNEGFVSGTSCYFITNVKDEISDKSIDDRYVMVETDAFASANVGRKNYTLNFDKLQQDLVAWFNADTKGYTDSNAVFAGGDTNDIQSLMAVYTADTKGCFVKA